MKLSQKLLAFILALLLVMPATAFASDYHGGQGNEATFETLEEARANAPTAVADLEMNVGKIWVPHPLLDDYPEGTTYVYRSAELFGGRAAARLNTNILVFAEQKFEGKDAALEYLKSLGLIEIVDKAIGTIILITPKDPEAGFTRANDMQNSYELFFTMFAQKASAKVGEETHNYPDAEYYGGRGYFYVIGIDGGATFLNNFMTNVPDFISRVAGMLLINGDMAPIAKPLTYVPTYLVNPADDTIIERYKAVNETDAFMREGDVEVYFKQTYPIKQVCVEKTSDVNLAECISRAYYNMFIKAMRVRIINQGNLIESPYSLAPRNALFDQKTEKRKGLVSGVTADGIVMNRVDTELFADIATDEGEYLCTWFEYLPREVLDGTAAPGSIPLVLSMHGSIDDPRLFVDHNGFLVLAGKERIAVVAPEHQYISSVRSEVLPKLAKYLLEKYPALDPSRVYISGYSMGGGATQYAVNGDASVFAAAVPMASSYVAPTEEQTAQFGKIDIPCMMTTSWSDYFTDENHNLNERYYQMINAFLEHNEMATIVPDFETYPIIGFKGDKYVETTINDEFKNCAWYLNNADGIPMVAVNFTFNLTHGIYPGQAEVAWNFMKHYSRNVETGEVIYNPYVD